uniref:Uncharacterized protein n=1 Tax=mine drainage metagenome TaxID=410659 RepID=E6QNA0_9ZZZZ
MFRLLSRPQNALYSAFLSLQAWHAAYASGTGCNLRSPRFTFLLNLQEINVTLMYGTPPSLSASTIHVIDCALAASTQLHSYP